MARSQGALHCTSIQNGSVLVVCRLVQLRNSVYRFVHFLSDPIDVVGIASRIYVYGPFHICNEKLGRLISSERVRSMLFVFEDKGKFKAAEWILRVFFKSVE